MKKLLFIMAVSALAAGCADNSIPKAQLPELDKSNPLLAAWDTPHETPPFSEIKLAHYEPAFDAAIACSRAEVEAIVKNPKKPTFGNTIVALERQGELLNPHLGDFLQPDGGRHVGRDAGDRTARAAQAHRAVERHFARSRAVRPREIRLRASGTPQKRG